MKKRLMEFRELNKSDEKKVLLAYKEILLSSHKYGYDKFSGAYCLKKLEKLNYCEFLEYLDQIKKNNGENSTQSLLALFSDKNEIIGFCTIRWDNTEKVLSYQGHCGAIIVPQYRGKGYSKLIFELAAKILFDYGKEYIIISSKIKNVDSYKGLEKCGAEFQNNYTDKDGQKYLVYKFINKK